MGDGERVRHSTSRIKDDLARGSADAAEKADIPALPPEALDGLLGILTEPARAVGVTAGKEVIVTDDGCSMAFYGGQDSSGVGAPLSRLQSVLTYERACGADTTSMGHSDYSFKPVKPIISYEAGEYHAISQLTTAPFLYGAQPNMGLYFRPDGPCPNPADLLPLGNIEAAQEAQEEAAEMLRRDLVFCGRKLHAVGCEALNFDTAGSAGDADFMAALQAAADLKAAAPGMPVIMGGSGEFVLGMHGEAKFEGRPLAGLYPREQVQVAEAAGVAVYGVAVGTRTAESLAWNIARAVTFLRAASEASRIPVHANVGMGVGGVPMTEVPPIDSVTRVAKSLVEIGKADGL
jgi:dimethylamine--corrinoid protein Co-methyltransferase